MELIGKEDLKVDLGDVMYYINTGSAKSHADVKKVTTKVEGKADNIEIQFNCERLSNKDVEREAEIAK